MWGVLRGRHTKFFRAPPPSKRVGRPPARSKHGTRARPTASQPAARTAGQRRKLQAHGQVDRAHEADAPAAATAPRAHATRKTTSGEHQQPPQTHSPRHRGRAPRTGTRSTQHRAAQQATATTQTATEARRATGEQRTHTGRATVSYPPHCQQPHTPAAATPTPPAAPSKSNINESHRTCSGKDGASSEERRRARRHERSKQQRPGQRERAQPGPSSTDPRTSASRAEPSRAPPQRAKTESARDQRRHAAAAAAAATAAAAAPAPAPGPTARPSPVVPHRGPPQRPDG